MDEKEIKDGHKCERIAQLTRHETIIEEQLACLPEQMKDLLVLTNQINVTFKYFTRDTVAKLAKLESDVNNIKEQKADIADAKLDKEEFYKWQREKFDPLCKEIVGISRLKWQLSGAIVVAMALWNLLWPIIQKYINK